MRVSELEMALVFKGGKILLYMCIFVIKKFKLFLMTKMCFKI